MVYHYQEGRNFTEPIEVKTVGHEKLLRFRANVDPDGCASTFIIHFSNQHPFTARCPAESMPAFFSEVRAAADLMLIRQSMRPDRGSRAMLDLCEHALHPTRTDVAIDPITGDRIFLMQFADHNPISIRMTPHEYEAAKVKVNLAVAANNN